MDTDHVRRERVVAIGLVVLLAVSLAGIAGWVLVEKEFEPQGSLLGLPARIPTCGREYRGPGRVITRAEMDATMTPGYAPVILEPTFGLVPLGAPFRGTDPCDTIVFLQTGADAFVGYSLSGGP